MSVGVDTTELQRAVADLRTRDLSPTMAVIAESLVAAVNDEFETAGRGRWEPLSERTLSNRRGTTAQILKDTGRFAASIRADFGPDFAEAATDVSYAVFHVSDAPRYVIPLRNPFDVEERVLEEGREMILAALVEGYA